MKQTLALKILLLIVLCVVLPAHKSRAQALPVDSLSILPAGATQTVSPTDSTRFDSLSSALKYSEIILYPIQPNRFLIQKLQNIVKSGKQDLFFHADSLTLSNLSSEQIRGVEKTSRPIWVLIVVFFLFLILGILRVIFPVELKIIMEAYYKERLLLQVSKEDNLATSWPYIFLYILFSLSFGLFVVVLISGFRNENYLTFENFLKNSGFVALIFIVKIIFIRFVSFIFLLDKIVREYIAILYLVYFNSMFFLMPFLLAVVFVPAYYFDLISIIYIVTVILLFAYRFIRTAIHLFGQFKFSIFYLILYLCSLEVAPVLILVRALNN